MEQLLVKIGELVATEIDDVEEIKYMDKEFGYMFYIILKNGKKIILSLVDSELRQQKWGDALCVLFFYCKVSVFFNTSPFTFS